MSQAPPGWYPDPDRPGGQRYFDGSWTEHRIDPPARLPLTEETLARVAREKQIAIRVAWIVTFVVVGVLFLFWFGH